MKVLSIDPGMRNLAHVVMENGHVISSGLTDIFKGEKIDREVCFDRITEWCELHGHLFEWADHVVIEKQFVDNKINLSTCLLIIQTVLLVWARDKRRLVHALTVKRFFGTKKENHAANKKASVAACLGLWPNFAEVHKGKIDDVADAYLQARFITAQFSKWPTQNGLGENTEGRE